MGYTPDLTIARKHSARYKADSFIIHDSIPLLPKSNFRSVAKDDLRIIPLLKRN